MTRKIAKAIIYNIQNNNPWTEKELLAFEMAIQALEQMPEVTSTMQTGQFVYVKEPCDDAVSRKKAIFVISARDGKSAQIEALEQLPSVNPQPSEHFIDGVHAIGYREGYKDAQKQKSGKWIRYKDNCLYNQCSYCGASHCREDNFCPNCGACMKDGRTLWANYTEWIT